jgi:hypothetical protein
LSSGFGNLRMAIDVLQPVDLERGRLKIFGRRARREALHAQAVVEPCWGPKLPITVNTASAVWAGQPFGLYGGVYEELRTGRQVDVDKVQTNTARLFGNDVDDPQPAKGGDVVPSAVCQFDDNVPTDPIPQDLSEPGPRRVLLEQGRNVQRPKLDLADRLDVDSVGQ